MAEPDSSLEWLCKTRPWWWRVNPWLYIKRRDRAYADALDILADVAARPVKVGPCR